jgi:hypothetical protein
MSNESVDELISQLELLRIQETIVLQRLVAARERESRATTRGNRTRGTSDTETEPFRAGGRVQLTNHIRLAFGRSATINDTQAYIKKVSQTRVYYFRTVSGDTTWRARSNL